MPELLALKVLHAGSDAREADAMAGLRHENLLGFFGSVQAVADSGDPAQADLDHTGHTSVAYLLEYARGGSLHQLLAVQHTLSIAQMATILVAIARAVDYLHRQDIAHADISTSNILFSAEGKPCSLT